jgi:hypothetical protein
MHLSDNSRRACQLPEVEAIKDALGGQLRWLLASVRSCITTIP